MLLKKTGETLSSVVKSKFDLTAISKCGCYDNDGDVETDG